MSILTGDFVFGTSCSDHRSDIAVTPEAADSASDDARLYRRHVEEGRSIRALAREAGCHPSTILRRIRRFESKRDDPLVDSALEKAAPTNDADHRQTLRILRRLAEPRAIMASAEGMEKAIISRDDIRTAVLERRLAEPMALNGWVVQVPGGGRIQRYVISPLGRDMLRTMLRSPRQRGAVPAMNDFADAVRVTPSNDAPTDYAPIDHAMAEAPAAFDHADRHRVWQDAVIDDPEDGRRRRARVNIAESPLLLLARRRDHDGTPFLSPGMVSAGERLREDFELAQIGPRVTQNWDGFLTSGVHVSRQGGGYGGGSDTARDRVAQALRELGPGMGDIVLRVCCFLEGIEMTERRLGWSARSGKIVLRLALMRLERYYQDTYGSGSRLIG